MNSPPGDQRSPLRSVVLSIVGANCVRPLAAGALPPGDHRSPLRGVALSIVGANCVRPLAAGALPPGDQRSPLRSVGMIVEIVLIFFPSCRIVIDILPFLQLVVLTADHMVIKRLLPYWLTNFLGNSPLELLDHPGNIGDILRFLRITNS